MGQKCPTKLPNMENIITFRTVQDALNYALDNNLFRLDLVDMENDLIKKLVHFAKHYKTYFVIDERA